MNKIVKLTKKEIISKDVFTDDYLTLYKKGHLMDTKTYLINRSDIDKLATHYIKQINITHNSKNYPVLVRIDYVVSELDKGEYNDTLELLKDTNGGK